MKPPDHLRRRQEALDRFERATELPLVLLALAMVPLLVIPLLADLPSTLEATFVAADWFIWAAFALEYITRLVLSPRRWHFVRRQWADLLIVALPFLRPLRVVRSARALRVLRLARLGSVLAKVGKDGRRVLVRHHLHHALLVIGVVILGAASLALIVEEAGGGSIDSFGDALWWAVATVTTVGYGDVFPVTPAGRGIAAVLMVTGIALFGFLTANLTSFFVEQGGTTATEHPLAARLDELLQRIGELEARLNSPTNIRAEDT
jgi:voltage-gated potassium channel